jgi:hypothetical protein
MAPHHRLSLAAIAFLAFTGCVAVDAGRSPSPESDGEIAALENAFWYCDYVATIHGVLAAPMAACQFATQELKARKFGGSFRALAAWWQENKAAEHARLGRTAAPQGFGPP